MRIFDLSSFLFCLDAGVRHEFQKINHLTASSILQQDGVNFFCGNLYISDDRASNKAACHTHLKSYGFTSRVVPNGDASLDLLR